MQNKFSHLGQLKQSEWISKSDGLQPKQHKRKNNRI